MTLPLLAQTPDSAALSAWDVLHDYGLVFVMALVVSVVATPLFARIARALGVVDHRDDRGGQRREVACLGGLAILVGWLVAVVVGAKLHLIGTPGMAGPIRGIVLGALVVVAVGLLDDLVGLSPLRKIAGQLAAAFVMMGFGHVGTDILVTSWPFESRPDPAVLSVASIVLSIAVVAGVCNAANLLDGLDGLCSGATVIIVSTLVVISVSLTMEGRDIVYDPTRMIVGLAILGAVIGFVPYNYNPASILMGNAGSMLLGFIAAAMILLLGERVPTQRYFWAALVVMGLPAFDLLLALFRRLTTGRGFFTPDAYHLHHQLIRQGLTVRQAVSVLYLLLMVFAAMGLLMVRTRLRYSVIVLLVLGFNLVLITLSFRLHRPGSPSRVTDESVARLPRSIDAQLVEESADSDAEEQPANKDGSSL
ncbi:MAG TPA: MraY family glycosyltransferase [Phycisphaerae bacterium]|nr:MraY family glycosyltransferase [Phycisphaerae bacterium]